MSNVARRCPACRKLFEPKRSDAKFCSTKCRVAAKRRGGVAKVRATLKRHPDEWWDDVRTYPAMAMHAPGQPPMLAVACPEAMLLEPGESVSIIFVTDRVTDMGASS